jgi:hypothetical protein
VIHITAFSAVPVLLGPCVEGLDVRTVGVSFNSVRVDLGEYR